MTYLAVIDYEHLDNALFLTTLAQALERHDYEDKNGILLHGDSEYTTRIMQSGIMREEAMKRSIRGLNNRLVSLFADEGISAIGLNGYQRQLISMQQGSLTLDRGYLDSLPTAPIWLISSLIQNLDDDTRTSADLPTLANLIRESFDLERIYLFARQEDGLFDQFDSKTPYQWKNISEEIIEKYLPSEFQEYRGRIRLTTAQKFGNFDDDTGFIDMG